MFVSCFVTACDKETRISTRQSQSGRSLPTKRSASASTSTLCKGSGTDKVTSGKHVFMYCLFNLVVLIGAYLLVLINLCLLLDYSW